MGWPLPAVPFPPDTVCIQVRVPNDPAYLDAFFGQILDMATAYNWANDDAHTALMARDRCRQMYSELAENNCPVPVPPLPGCGCDCEDCMQLRINCGVLQQFDCISQSWVDVPTTGDCAPNPAPGAGATQPGPGQSSGNVCMSADASTLTPLPWNVNTGDTLDFTSVMGAGNDGTSATYFCPDGSIFFLGACAGGGFTSGSDPLPTAKHMALLLKIGSTFYTLTDGIFTVPSSITNQPVYIQVNAPTIANARGKYNLCVTYTNNGVVAWHAHIDFTINSGGFTALPRTVGVAGLWVPSTGWEAQDFNQGGENYTGTAITLTLDPCTITRIIFQGETSGNSYGSIEGGEAVEISAGENYINTNRLTGGAYTDDTSTTTYDGVGFTLPQSGQTLLELVRWVSTHTHAGTGAIQVCDVYGTGTAPSQLVPFLI